MDSDWMLNAAQSAWDNASTAGGPDFSGGYPCCKWCHEPTSSEYLETDSVKKPFGPDADFCEDCGETYSCAKCGELSSEVPNDPDRLCPGCK